MKQTKYFNQNIPQLGDQANITVVSDAIYANEENYSGKVEYMNATNAGPKVLLNSDSRVKRNVGYYKGMAFVFAAPIPLTPSGNHTVSVDGLGEQPLRLGHNVNRGEEVRIVYDRVKGFSALNVAISRSSSLTSTSETTVATSKAVNDIYKDLWRIKPKKIGDSGYVTDLDDIRDKGYYISESNTNKFNNIPSSIDGAFELTVTGTSVDNYYNTQLIKDYRSNTYYVRTNVSDGVWNEWDTITTGKDMSVIASTSQLGRVRIGKTIKISSNGTIDVISAPVDDVAGLIDKYKVV